MKLSNNPLSRPFPEREFGRDSVLGMARVAVFIFFALYFLRPLGFNAPGNLAVVCLGYAAVTFVVGVGYAYFTERVLGWERTGPGWTLGRWILDCGVLLMLISAGNFVYYNWLVGWTAFSGMVLAYVALPTVLIGLFPIAFSGMAIQLRAERENRRAALGIRSGGRQTFSAPASAPLLTVGRGELALDPADLIFAEARQNYVRLVFFDGGVVREQTVRATLSSLVEQLTATAVLRCHRSYLVNPAHVRRAEGNAQGLQLTLVGTEEKIPVSRAYVGALRQAVAG